MDYYTVRVVFTRTDSGFFVDANLPDRDNLKDHFIINKETLAADIDAMTTNLKAQVDAKLEEIESRKNAS